MNNRFDHISDNISIIVSYSVVSVKWTTWAPDPNSPHGLCGCKATFEEEGRTSEIRSCVTEEVDDLDSRP